MSINLDHTIVPATNKEVSANFFASIMGLKYHGTHGHFAPVKVNDSLTMDFDNRVGFESHHYAFKVSEEDFDKIFERIQLSGTTFGSEPYAQSNMKINKRNGGRGVYFADPDGHSFEILTI